IVAVPYDADLLPPVGILVQNDQNLGDAFDEYRFVWRGYGPGTHTFQAHAALTGGTQQENEVIGSIVVEGDIPGPSVTITSPAPPGETINSPTSISVIGSFNDATAKFARIFIDLQSPLPLGEIATPAQGAFQVTRP